MNLSKKDMIRKSPGRPMHQGNRRRAGVDDRGRPTPAGSEVVSAGAILAVAKAGVFSKWQFAFRIRTPMAQRRAEKTTLPAILVSATRKAKRLSAYRDIGTRIGGSNWLNTEYPGFAVGDDPGAPIVIGASFAFGAVSSRRLCRDAIGGLGIGCGRRSRRRRWLFGNARGKPEKHCMTKSLVIGGLLF